MIVTPQSLSNIIIYHSTVLVPHSCSATLHAMNIVIHGRWVGVRTVHDTENFFRRRPRGKSAYIRADNQRIPRGTISKFYSYNDISNDPCGVFLDPLALLRTKFAFWFLPFSNQIRTEDSCPSVGMIRARPHGKSAAPARKFRGTRAENPRRSARNNHGIPRKKLSFPCHVLYVCTI